MSKLYKAQALLFDMDGTLVDSTEAVERTWKYFADKYHLNLKDILSQSHGRLLTDTVRLFAPKNIDIIAVINELSEMELNATQGIKEIVGAKDLLNKIPDNRWAIVTSASKKLAVSRLNAARLPIPKVLITADDVKHGKPSPEGYLIAAGILQIAPQECIVFEDSVIGLTAARNAKMKALAVGGNTCAFAETCIKDYTVIDLNNSENSNELILNITE